MAADKKRWPRDTAELIVAAEIVEALDPACERLRVAGSLRRGRPVVGDVELVFIPRHTIEDDPADMFAKRRVDHAERAIEELLARGVLAKRLDVNGRESWGPKNKLATHVATGMPVDLFTATAANWWNYLVCRTGPAESNMQIAQAALAKGWQWHPYGSGFSCGGRDDVDYERHNVNSEAEVFEFVGLPLPAWLANEKGGS